MKDQQSGFGEKRWVWRAVIVCLLMVIVIETSCLLYLHLHRVSSETDVVRIINCGV